MTLSRNFLFILFLIPSGSFGQIKELYLACDPANFQFIYDNYEQDIYIPATLEYNGNTWSDVSVRIRGDGSRVFPKKSLKVRFNQGAFVDGRTSLNLNAEWEDRTYMQSALASRLMLESGQTCFQTEHVRLYLNGSFLGLYLLVEAVDVHFLETRNMDTLGNMYKAALDGSSLSIFDQTQYHWEQKTGLDINMADLDSLINGLNNWPQSTFGVFVDSAFIRDEMVNMIAMNVLLSLGSTYYHNYFMYRDPVGKKWSMLPWDLDKTLSYYGSNFPYQRSSPIWVPDNPYHEKALQDTVILESIRTRIIDLSNTLFNLTHVDPIIDSIQAVITPSVVEDATDNVSDVAFWQNEVDFYRSRLSARVPAVLIQIDQFPRSFTVERLFSATPGSTQTIHWTPSVSPVLRPIEYRFLLGNELDLDSTASLIIDQITDTLVQFTVPTTEGLYYYKVQASDGFSYSNGFDTYNPIYVTDNVPPLVINEINYNSAPELPCGDWVELHNPLPYPVNLEGWELKDNQNDNAYIFGTGDEIPAGGFLVVARDLAAFVNSYPSVTPMTGGLTFGFGNGGDQVRLFHSSGLLVDEVQYQDSVPWPPEADGTGPTLELLQPELDNALSENWRAWVSRYGTPGEPNYNGHLSVGKDPEVFQATLVPNPTSDGRITLQLRASKARYMIVSIYSPLGESVLQKKCTVYPGQSAFTFNLGSNTSGVYVLRIQGDAINQTHRFIHTTSPAR